MDQAAVLLRRMATLLGTHSAEVADRLDRWSDAHCQNLRRLERPAQAPPDADLPLAPDGTAIVLPPPRRAIPVIPDTTMLRVWQTGASWGGWEGIAGVEMLPRGQLRFPAQSGAPGVVTLPARLRSGGLYRLSIAMPEAADVRLRVLDKSGAILSDHAVSQGESGFFCFVSHRLQTVRLMIAPARPERETVARIASVQLDAVDIETFQQSRAHLAPAPVIASLVGEAGGAGLRDAVESLLVQCDAVRVLLRDYHEVPEFLRRPRVECRLCGAGQELPDESPFGWHVDTDDRAFHVLASDQVIVPPDFCATMLEVLARHAYRAVAGTSGWLARPPAAIAVPAGSAERTVHLLALGAVMLHGGCVTLHGSADGLAADAALAMAAQRAGVPMVSVPQAAHWLQDRATARAVKLPHGQNLTLRRAGRPKLGLLLVGTTGARLDAALCHWHGLMGDGIDWVVILAAPAADPRLHRRWARLPRELHRVDPLPEGGPATSRALALAATLGLDLLCVAADGMRFHDLDWLTDMARRGQAGEALGVFMAEDNATPRAAGPEEALLLAITDDASQWQGPGSALAEPLAAAVAAAAGTPFHLPPTPARTAPAPLPLCVNEVFERVVVLNRDEDFARWPKLRAALAEAGIAARRARMVDAGWPEVAREYAEYLARKLPAPRDRAAIQSDDALYLGAGSQAARVAYVAHRDGRAPIGSAAAWARLRGWERVLTRAWRDGVASLLLLDDDIVPDARAAALFAAAAGQLPDNWLCLRLGTSSGPGAAARQHARLLWRTGGMPVGSFAVGLRAEAFPFLLAQIRRQELELDEGPLSALTRVFADRCFAMAPGAIRTRISPAAPAG